MQAVANTEFVSFTIFRRFPTRSVDSHPVTGDALSTVFTKPFFKQQEESRNLEKIAIELVQNWLYILYIVRVRYNFSFVPILLYFKAFGRYRHGNDWAYVATPT